MSERTYIAKLKDRDVKITNRDLAVFRDMVTATTEASTSTYECSVTAIDFPHAARAKRLRDFVRAQPSAMC